MTAQVQLELSHVLADSIVRETRVPQPPHPDVRDMTDGLDTHTTTTQYLIDILARIWANELEDDSIATLTGLAAGKDDARKGQVIPTRHATYSISSRRELISCCGS